MVPNPCCCELQLGVKIVAIYNLVINVIALGLSIFAIVGLFILMAESTSDDDTWWIVTLIFLIVFILVVLAHCYLSYMLYQGAKTRNISRCKLWLIVTIFYLIINILSSITSPASIATSIVAALIQIYQIWVVYAFMEEVKNESLPHTHAEVHVVHTYPPPTGYPPQQPYGAGPSAMEMPPLPQQYGPTDPHFAPAYGHHDKL